MYETTADLNEQIYYERLDADLLQAQYEQESAQVAALRRKGICTHGARLGRRVPAFYDAESIAASLAAGEFGNRGGFEGDQTAIPEGYNLCYDCGELVVDEFA